MWVLDKAGEVVKEASVSSHLSLTRARARTLVRFRSFLRIYAFPGSMIARWDGVRYHAFSKRAVCAGPIHQNQTIYKEQNETDSQGLTKEIP